MNEHDDLHDEKISALYRQLPPVEPKPETDALILAAARRAVGAGPQRRLRPGWRSGLATAASVLLVGVLYMWQGPAYRHTESMAPAPVAAPAAPVAAPAPADSADIGALQAAGPEPEALPVPATPASGGSAPAHRHVAAAPRALSPAPVMVEEAKQQPAQVPESRAAESYAAAPPALADNAVPERQSRSMAPPASSADVDGALNDKEPAPATAPAADLALAAPHMQGRENRAAESKAAAPAHRFALAATAKDKLSLPAASAPPVLADNAVPESQSRSMAPPSSSVDVDELLNDREPAPAAAPSAGLALAAPQAQGMVEPSRQVYQLYMEQGRYALAYQQIDITLALHDPWVRLDYDLLALLDNPAHRPLLCRQHPVKKADDAIAHAACLVLHDYEVGSARHRAAQARARRRLAQRIGAERPERDYWLRALDALEEQRAAARKAR